jgi:hypothetical protein
MHTPEGDRIIEATDILVAAGRTPNTAGIGLDLAGVALDGGSERLITEPALTNRPMASVAVPLALVLNRRRMNCIAAISRAEYHAVLHAS